MSDHHLTDTAFSSLGLVPQLMQGVQAAGFTHCTPIQVQTLLPLLAGTDVAGQAQTGTGKTAAFLLAVFQRLLQVEPAPGRRRNQPRALILAPTRELAIQIHKDAEVLGTPSGLRLVLAYGGTGYDTQRAAIQEGVDVLIGTPGRLIDYFKQHVFDLRAIDAIVLDEADRMFDLGFIKDIRYLLRRMPPPEDRLSMLFSATLSYRVTELAYEHMNNPKIITVDADKRTVDTIRQVVYHPANEEKIPLLLGLLKHMDPTRTMVFVNTKRTAERLAAYLAGNGLEAAMLSGDVPQRQRQSLLGRFLRGELPILVATDVAARGLHIPDVSHVFNYDLPQDAEDYVHRVGRTARAGASGDAISFACEDSAFSLPEIEAYIGLKIAVQPITREMMLMPLPPARIHHAERPRHGARGSRQGPGGSGRDGRRRQRRPRTESAT